MFHVSFESQGVEVAENLYVPDHLDLPAPGVVIIGPMTFIKEQAMPVSLSEKKGNVQLFQRLTSLRITWEEPPNRGRLKQRRERKSMMLYHFCYE